MERVLDLYSQPYDMRYPEICMDEQPKPLRANKRTPQPTRPSRPATYNYAYVRRGPCTLWMFVEPLGQWAHGPRHRPTHGCGLGAPCAGPADHPRDRLIRVCDNLNTRTYASFDRAFPRAEARRLARRVQMVFTPRHGSWPHRAEPELSVLTRQALSPRGRRPATRPKRTSTGSSAPRTLQTSVPYNRNMIEY